MAKTVGDLLIKLGVDGIEGVTALKGSLRTLSNVSTASDKQLERLRKEIIQVAKASNVSQQSIRGQIDAFKGLKQQATIGSSVYKRLGKDIDAITQSLDRLNRKEEETKKQRTAKQIFGTESVAVVPEKFNRQIAAGNELLQKLGVTSTQYATQLAAVTVRTQEFSRAQQRQQVIAQNLVATNRAQTTGFLQSSKVNIENTHTTAALKQKIAELAQDLDNIDVGSKEYLTTSNRLKEAQEELNIVLGISSKAFDELSRAQERSERRAKKLADIQQYYGTSKTGEGQAAQRAGGFRDPATGAMIARGTRAGRASLVQQPMREISSLYGSIGDIGMSKISADIDRMGKSYQEVTQDIREATLASNGSVNSLQAQRASWAQLRAGLDPTSKAYQNVGREIEKVDRRLEKLNKRRRRPTIGGAASALGGIAAGGVFGGPEGAVGGAIGGAVGGVAGVAAGAAIGAQVKMMREALGATSEYAAELQKLEIALEGVTQVTDKFGNIDVQSSLGNFQAGLQAAVDVTKDFNVPLSVSTKGITRLAAAVIGAGGNIGDAEVVFRNITSAIKATGGGAQDVESAITAMVQTFSKGKVSAEELSGQLGERLPGAVTKFAEANNMTLPELQKAFKAGTVGLDQLMKFIISLGPEYEETARKIADSSADAGAKAAVAFDQVRREIGEALQPIGADLQKAFGEFALEVLPAIKGAAVAAGAGLKILMDAITVLIQNLKEIAVVAGVAGAVGAFLNLTKIVAALKVAVFDLKLAFAVLTKTMLLNPFVALAAGAAAAAIALHKATTANKRFNESVIKGEVSNEQANDKLREMNNKVKELEARLEKETNNRMIRALKRQLDAAKIAADDLQLAMKLASSYEVAGIKYDRMTGRPIDAPTSYTPTDFDDPTSDGSGSGGKDDLAERIKRAQELEASMARRLAVARQENELGKFLVQQENKRAELQDRIAKLKEGGTTEELDRATAAAQELQVQEQAALLQERVKQISENALKPLQDAVQAVKDKVSVEERTKELLAKGIGPERAKAIIAIEKEKKKTIEILDIYIAVLEAKVAQKTATEAEIEALERLRKAKKDAEGIDGEGATAGGNYDEEKSEFEQFKEVFEKGLDDMINVGPKLAGVALNAIGSVTDGLVELITTGKANFKEMAASILKDIAKIMIQAAIAGAIKKMFFAADGAVVQGGRIKPYAKGGVVAAPTLFPMSGGDVGLMGEAGPEAIMPLKRGNNGKLGVEVAGRSNALEAMSRYSVQNNGRGSIGSGGTDDPSRFGAEASPQPIDVRYNVERINSVDYVTAQEFQAGMRQAADQGAKQGEQKALRRLQMSGSTRKRLGM